MTEDTARHRLAQLLQLVGREDSHLQGVRERLFRDTSEATPDWVRQVTGNPDGIDRLESFGAKFSRLQDTLVDKLLPALLQTAGEQPGAVIDNLNRAEALGWLNGVERWIAMRRIRNQFVHDYLIDPEEMAAALEQARRFTAELHGAYEAMQDYARGHLDVPSTP